MGCDMPAFRFGVEAPERVGVGRQGAARQVQHLGEHCFDVERAEERGRGLEEQAEPLDLLGVEAVVLLCSAFDVLSRQ
jgi:hypothetical protein